ncbi:MAG: hypothetical protein LBP56_01480 [Odoribacteraceae bacterium]|jgi:hypothetical protein|nr:hypothetical protein [Odoribacteraceae bacterium]
MKDEVYDYFLNLLKKKFPRRAELTRSLVDLLTIEKEAVYRRLRKEVPFTFNEMAVIARAWDISLDTVIRVEPTRSLPFCLQLLDHLNPLPEDIQAMERFAKLLRFMSEEPRSESMEVSNLVPFSLYHGFAGLSRFFLFKWIYQYGEVARLPSFGEVVLSEEVNRLANEQNRLMKHVSQTFYVLDHMLFNYLVNDIRYFASIYLLRQEEVARLKEDILGLLDYLEVLAATGKFPETGNRVYLYISPINFDTNYCYLEGKTAKMSMIRTFVMNAVVSLDEHAFRKLKDGVLAMKRSSTLISESGEKHRIEFFEKQRALVESLTSCVPG